MKEKFESLKVWVINNKVASVIIAILLVVILVGSCSNEEIVEETDNTTVEENVKEPKEKAKEDESVKEDKVEDEYVQPEEVTVPEQPQQSTTSKEDVCAIIRQIGQSSMGNRYQVEVVIADDGNCVISVLDKEFVYSGYSRAEIQATAEECGLPQIYSDLASSAEVLFDEAGCPTNVVVMIGGADGQYFMLVDSNGNVMYQ